MARLGRAQPFKHIIKRLIVLDPYVPITNYLISMDRTLFRGVFGRIFGRIN